MTKTALVTGGNRGIGLAIVKGLAGKGLNVLLGTRDIEAARRELTDLPLNVTLATLDLATTDKTKAGLEAILSEHDSIDVLVNNAGMLEQGNLLEVDTAAFERALRVNALAPFELMNALIPNMLKRGYGRVVNMSSGWGSFGEGLDGPSTYSVSKATLNAMTKSVCYNLAPNVKVNTMCPGWVRTRMGGANAARSPEEGAETALWLALLPDDGPSGQFFRDKQVIPW